ncbi:uncharacterized protein F5891DRAFT_1189352 [Suillus fuscotomentosus]|uniref:Uncharacterized protein n=1 Tax=Suillus fuscotomentosus TaxID=1912939 RepID=A0AAD4HJF7_9AGAM|nr:uncharacterized protein F5891DRAFT_1189352 [Suillus fuscotomentosus]KAG1899880.1 hypothetical protein F5891DRAFT_1189352 [Suillus fuscotomentosus]
MKDLQKEIEWLRDLEQQHSEGQKTALDGRGQVIVAGDSLDVDIEPGEVTLEGDTINRRSPSPRRIQTQSVLSVSDGKKRRRSVSPPRNQMSYYPYRKQRHQEPVHREYPSSQRDRDYSAHHYRPRSPERFTRRGRSPSPTRARDNSQYPNHYHNTVHRTGHRSPSPHHAPPSKWRHLDSNYPSINLTSAAPSIPRTSSLPMGCLQFVPSSTVTTVAGFDRTGPHPVHN